eukprot:gene11044-7677_t
MLRCCGGRAAAADPLRRRSDRMITRGLLPVSHSHSHSHWLAGSGARRTLMSASSPLLRVDNTVPGAAPVETGPRHDVESQKAMEDFAAGIETSMASNLDLGRDLCGPWLVMAEGSVALENGELLLEPDGFAFFRPTSGLGYGVGRLELLTSPGADGTAFTLELEVYHYQAEAVRLPRCATKARVSGIVNKVFSKSTNYATFSLFGAWEAEAEAEPSSSAVPAEKEFAGAFHAAKVMPWDSNSAEAPWAPAEELQKAFEHVFPEPLQLTSHLRRAEDLRLKAMEAAANNNDHNKHPNSSSSRLRGPFHMDLAPYRVSELSSLYYIPNYISKEEEAQIVKHVQRTPEGLKSKLTKRTCQEWGCTMCDVCHKSFVADTTMPAWVQQTTEMLLYDGIFTPATFPNSVRIHEYEKNEGIGPHADGPIYVPLVSVLSGASTSVMHFYPRTPLHKDPMQHYKDTFQFKDGAIGSQAPLLSVVLEPRSLLLFTGDVYYDHPHGISDEPVVDLSPAVSGQIVNRHLLEDKDIQQVVRDYRVSITTRNLLPRCRDQPRRAEFSMKRAWYIYHQETPPEPLFPLATAAAGAPSPSAGGMAGRPLGEGEGRTDLRRWESKLDRALGEQEMLRREVQQLQQMVAGLSASSGYFQSETSGVLNHLTTALLDIQSRTEEVLEVVEEGKGSST